MRFARPLLVLAGLAAATPVLAQATPLELNMQLAAMAAPLLQQDGGPSQPIEEFAAALVCIIEALHVVPDDDKATMVAMADFEDALDFIVKLQPEVEDLIEACF